MGYGIKHSYDLWNDSRHEKSIIRIVVVVFAHLLLYHTQTRLTNFSTLPVISKNTKAFLFDTTSRVLPKLSTPWSVKLVVLIRHSC